MALFRRFANLFRRSTVDHEIDAELQAHIAMRIESNLAAGMSAEEARRDALLRFGNRAVTKERVAGSDATLSFADLGRDIRYAMRQLRRSPGFALTAILTLALGIGANVVVFGVLNAMVLRPLNVSGSDRLMELANDRPGDDNQSYPDYVDFKTRNSAFVDMATYRLGYAGMSSGGTAQNHEANTILIVRSELPQAEIASALNHMLTGIDSSLPFTLRAWPDRLSLVLFPARIATLALGVMGLLAAMLAVTGVFGMAAYTVSKRMRELGIRAALGAHRGQIMRAALSRPLLVLLSGSAAGLVLGVLASRLLAALVYEATPRDPLVLVGAVAAMTLIGLIATWIPARRAMAINPAQLLRQE